MPEYQQKGIARGLTASIIDWFRTHISQDAVLCGLALTVNQPSQRALTTNGFYPLLDADNQQVTTTAWEREYLVFETKR